MQAFNLSSTVTEEKTFTGTTITSGGPVAIGALNGKLSNGVQTGPPIGVEEGL